ncbi:MAG: hypothetical protein OXK21_06330 [Chloroflexota bacterium]|nr:hypothetical protein [Chloroflexota bacterium]
MEWETVWLIVLLAPNALFVAGVLWAPFGGIWGILLARAHKVPWHEGLGAGVYSSVALLLPWFFLMGRGVGIRLPRELDPIAAGAVLVAVYALWACSYIIGPLVYLALIYVESPTYYTAGEYAFVTVGFMLLSAGSAVAWVLTGRGMYQQWRDGGRNGPATQGTLGDPWYMVPWGAVACLSIVWFTLWFISVANAFSGQ